MDYKEKYELALSRARKLNSEEGVSAPSGWTVCETIFPELRESEDERIRKALIKYLDALDDDEIRYGVSFKDMRTWLEKQGEQKPADKIEQSCYHNDGLYYAIDILEKTFGKVEGYQSDDGKMEHQTAIETVNALYHKKPAEWSKEDERMLDEVIKHVRNYQQIVNPANETGDSDLTIWLKSLRPQPHWKPSEQNIKDLEWCANLVKDKMGVGFHRLQVFIDDLKKL